MLFYNSDKKKWLLSFNSASYSSNHLKDKCGDVFLPLCDTHLRDEEQSRCSAGDGFDVFFIVAAVVANQQIVEDAHNAHQEQEEEDSFSKQVAGSAAEEI